MCCVILAYSPLLWFCFFRPPARNFKKFGAARAPPASAWRKRPAVGTAENVKMCSAKPLGRWRKKSSPAGGPENPAQGFC
jgi:hypothetical protein